LQAQLNQSLADYVFEEDVGKQYTLPKRIIWALTNQNLVLKLYLERKTMEIK
jgi:hypothetical protein